MDEQETKVDRALRALAPERDEMGDYDGWMRALAEAGLNVDEGDASPASVPAR